MAGESGEGGNIDDFVDFYMDLHKSLKIDDWIAANEFLFLHPHAIRAKITDKGETALHVAAEAGHVRIVEELVKQMSEEDLEIVDNNGYTALALAASSGYYSMAQCMLGKNKNLCRIREKQGNIPVTLALYNGHSDLAWLFYSRTPPDILDPEICSMGAVVLREAILSKTLCKNLLSIEYYFLLEIFAV